MRSASVPFTWWFQSAPTIAGGRILLVNAEETGQRPVSIRAHHCWWANPSMSVVLLVNAEVSIRAHHCWWANPWLFLVNRDFAQGFNPRPPLLVGESEIAGCHCDGGAQFQSAPTIAGGRIRPISLPTPASQKFQSAPTIAGGRIPTSPRMNRWAASFQSAPTIAGGRIRACA